MSHQGAIESVRASAFRIPTDNGPEADGTLRWDATEVVVAEITCGEHCGLGYSYTAAPPARDLIEGQLAGVLIGGDPMDIPTHWRRLRDKLRNAGRPGLGMMAIAALDQALWDLKAKLLGVPLTALWGKARPYNIAYGSGGFVNQDEGELEKQLQHWLDQGFNAVKIKIGTDIEEDTQRVALAREVIGANVDLMVDANGAYDARSAIALIDKIEPFGVCWLEEPVSSDNLAGLRRLRDRSPGALAIAAGEYGWDLHYYQTMLSAGAVDVLQADATRCGFTAFLQVAALCSAYSVPLSSHCAPAIHASLCSCLPMFRHQEYFHDHVRIESMIFHHQSELREGTLSPDDQLPGHGVSLERAAAEAYRVQ